MPSDEQGVIATIVFLDGRRFQIPLHLDFFPDVLHGFEREIEIYFVLDEDGEQEGIYRQASDWGILIPVESD